MAAPTGWVISAGWAIVCPISRASALRASGCCPFYPSPRRDDGYDVQDYYGVDPRFGTLGDFVDFTRQAEELGIRVIVDLVVNHTSDQHPWFNSARSDPKSPYRDWYIWSKTKPKDATSGIVCPGVQKTTWTYDKQVGQPGHVRLAGGRDRGDDLVVGAPMTIGAWQQLV
jgi:maltooligosyltrehalose synthase